MIRVLAIMMCILPNLSCFYVLCLVLRRNTSLVEVQSIPWVFTHCVLHYHSLPNNTEALPTGSLHFSRQFRNAKHCLICMIMADF